MFFNDATTQVDLFQHDQKCTKKGTYFNINEQLFQLLSIIHSHHKLGVFFSGLLCKPDSALTVSTQNNQVHEYCPLQKYTAKNFQFYLLAHYTEKDTEHGRSTTSFHL